MLYEGKALDDRMQSFKGDLLKCQEENRAILGDYYNGLIDYAVNEIDNPKPAPEGKYKIPHKFLYDEARKRGETQSFEDVISAVADYREFDGQFDEKDGKTLEEMYTSDDNYLFMHNVNYKGDHPSKEEQDEICENICKNGLNLTTMGNEVGNIDYTTISTRDKNRGMLSFMPNMNVKSGIVMLQIPKKKVDNGAEIIGSDNPDELSPKNPGAVLPEYVSGYLSSNGYKENPVSMEDRKNRYKFKFSEGSSEMQR